MKRKIASEKDVENALQHIFRENHVIPSQRKLKELISKILREKSVGEYRLRRIAIHNRIARLKIFTRESRHDFDLDRCPVCGGEIFVVTTRDIWGKLSKTEYICRKCGYRSGVKKRIPTRYVFYSMTS